MNNNIASQIKIYKCLALFQVGYITDFGSSNRLLLLVEISINS